MSRDRVIELAAAHAPADGRLAGSSYSSVVAVDAHILQERGGAASLVHGIANEEIALGPTFAEAWGRFLHWTRALLDSAVREEVVDTDDDEPRAPFPEEAPVLLLAGHNGVRTLVVAAAAGKERGSPLTHLSSRLRCVSTSPSCCARWFVTIYHAGRLRTGALWTLWRCCRPPRGMVAQNCNASHTASWQRRAGRTELLWGYPVVGLPQYRGTF